MESKATESKIVYFENPGVANTERTLSLAKQRAKELGINTVLVASTIGDTAVKAVDVFKGMRVIIVTHSTGVKEDNFQEVTEENKKIVEQKGGIVLTTGHAFGGLNRAMRQNIIPNVPTTYIIGDIVAETLRTFGQGMKVVCEIAVMAADAGLVRTDEDVIAVGGTGRGADVAVVVKPACAHRFFELEVKEILCKPRNRRRR